MWWSLYTSSPKMCAVCQMRQKRGSSWYHFIFPPDLFLNTPDYMKTAKTYLLHANKYIMSNYVIMKWPENLRCKTNCLWTKAENYVSPHVIKSISSACDHHHSICTVLLLKSTETTNSLREENYLEFYSHCLLLEHHFPQPLNLLAIICSCTANFESNSPKLHVQSQILGARISTRGIINFRVPSAIAGSSLCEIYRNEAEQTTVFNWTHKVNICMPTVRVGCKFPRDIWVDIKSESSPDSKTGGNYFVTQLSKRPFKDHRLQHLLNERLYEVYK